MSPVSIPASLQLRPSVLVPYIPRRCRVQLRSLLLQLNLCFSPGNAPCRSRSRHPSSLRGPHSVELGPSYLLPTCKRQSTRHFTDGTVQRRVTRPWTAWSLASTTLECASGGPRLLASHPFKFPPCLRRHHPTLSSRLAALHPSRGGLRPLRPCRSLCLSDLPYHAPRSGNRTCTAPQSRHACDCLPSAAISLRWARG